MASIDEMAMVASLMRETARAEREKTEPTNAGRPLSVLILIKETLRKAYIGKRFVEEIHHDDGMPTVRTTFKVEHLLFSDNKLVFPGTYYDFFPIELEYHNAVELADKGRVESVSNICGSLITHVYTLEEE